MTCEKVYKCVCGVKKVRMGEYMISYDRFDKARYCGECRSDYDVGYEFMILKCGCGCATSFEICSICSPMYMQCECGCKGSYAACNQRPTYGNLTVGKTVFLKI